MCFHERPEALVLQVVEDFPEFFISMDSEAVRVPAEAAQIGAEGERRFDPCTQGPIVNSFFCTREYIRFNLVPKVDRARGGGITRYLLRCRRTRRRFAIVRGRKLTLTYTRGLFVKRLKSLGGRLRREKITYRVTSVRIRRL